MIAKKIEKKFKTRFKFYQSKFSQIDQIINHKVDTIVFDLGISSIQLNNLNSILSMFASVGIIGLLYAIPKIALAVYSPIPGKVIKSSYLFGILELKFFFNIPYSSNFIIGRIRYFFQFKRINNLLFVFNRSYSITKLNKSK